MSIHVNIVSAARPERVLGERLERLTGEEAACCVPEYHSIAKEILRSPSFPAALQRVKALADENRLLALSLLKRRGELCACEIQATTGLTHATVSHHMSVLVEAELVLAQREGKWMYYRLAKTAEVKIP
jgi:ArsR family transcriptional regulator, arsenate/arsenite/antimonite-responsive transcriptional repressor